MVKHGLAMLESCNSEAANIVGLTGLWLAFISATKWIDLGDASYIYVPSVGLHQVDDSFKYCKVDSF